MLAGLCYSSALPRSNFTFPPSLVSGVTQACAPSLHVAHNHLCHIPSDEAQPAFSSSNTTITTAELMSLTFETPAASTDMADVIRTNDLLIPPYHQVVFDSEYDFTMIPADVFPSIADYFNATFGSKAGPWKAPCDVTDGSVNFGLDCGCLIDVPFRALVGAEDGEENGQCMFGLMPGPVDGVLVFGMPFMDSSCRQY